MSTENITDIHGNTRSIDCLSCAIVNRDVDPPGALPTSTYFDAHQDYEIPIPGFIIVASKRHVKRIDEFTPEEQADFMSYIVRLRKAMKDILHIDHIILVQDEETRHHFHAWLFPKYDWMEKQFGKKVEHIREILEYARTHLKTEENLTTVKDAIKKLSAHL